MSSLTECIEKLSSADEGERAFAAEDLGYMNTPQGALALLASLPEENSQVVRDAIFQALIRTDGDEAIEGSVHLFSSEDAQIRNLAVGVLQHKGGLSVPFLKTAMREGNEHIRKLVVDALGGIPAEVARDIYLAALADGGDPNVVITAVESIGRMRASEFRHDIEELLRGAEHPMLTAACLEALAELGGDSSLDAVKQRFADLQAQPDFYLTPCLKLWGALGRAADFSIVAK
jgi:HEAT repeat protein